MLVCLLQEGNKTQENFSGALTFWWAQAPLAQREELPVAQAAACRSLTHHQSCNSSWGWEDSIWPGRVLNESILIFPYSRACCSSLFLAETAVTEQICSNDWERSQDIKFLQWFWIKVCRKCNEVSMTVDTLRQEV